MAPDPVDRPSDGLDPESERWWRELTRLDEEPPPTNPRGPVRGAGRGRRRRGDRRRHVGRHAGGTGRLRTTVTRSLLTFFAVLLVAMGAISVVERGWEQTREASFDEGGHLDGTVVEGEDGRYAFLQTLPGTEEPVTYGRCDEVEVQVNPAGEVPGGTQLVLESMAEVSRLSGVELVYAGPSDQRPEQWERSVSASRPPAFPPALVAWSDEEETPGLAGDVVGLGGSVSVQGGGRAPQRYVTGSVMLDGPTLAEILEQDDGEQQVRAVILHELGHLLGLGHVDDPGELMSSRNSGQTGFGPGDREGLAKLGAGDC